MIRIGIITAQSSLNWIKTLEENLAEDCEVTYIPYRDQTEIKNIYLQNHTFFDGIIFSGELPYLAVKKELASFNKPTVYLDITERDFYKALCKAMVEHKNFDFSRTLIDFLFKQNANMGLDDLLKKEEFPYIFKEDIRSFGEDTIYEDLVERHLSLWQQGKIDLSFTRASNISETLFKHNIKHVVVTPSKESMHEKVSQLLKEIELRRLEDNQPVIGIFSIKETENGPDSEFEWKQLLLNKALLEFSKLKQVELMVKKNALNVEAITSKRELMLITDDFKTSNLLSFLNTALPFSVGIGWGVGHSMHEAHENATQANEEAMRNKVGSTAFWMTENDHLIGPLGDGECIDISNEVNPQIEHISRQTGISTLQIQKLLAIMEKLNTNELMSDDVAKHLGITIRAASRILNNLEEKGVAEVLVRKQKKMKGRPKKLYKIDFYKHASS